MLLEIELTADERARARHALGLPGTRNVSYRNYYVTARDDATWLSLVAKGAATQTAGLRTGNVVFRLTHVGALAALEPGEQLCREDFPVTE